MMGRNKPRAVRTSNMDLTNLGQPHHTSCPKLSHVWNLYQTVSCLEFVPQLNESASELRNRGSLQKFKRRGGSLLATRDPFISLHNNITYSRHVTDDDLRTQLQKQFRQKQCIY